MVNRELGYLIQNQSVKNFLTQSGLQYIVSDGQVFLLRNCLLIHIYSYMSEDYVYFDVFNIMNQTQADLDILIQDFIDKSEVQKICMSYRNNPRFTKIEALFFEGLYFLSRFFQDMLHCDFRKYESAFKPIHEARKMTIAETMKRYGYNLFPS